MSSSGRIKPIAVDFGKFYWIIARTDDNTKEATVAKLGDGGLIPTLIGERGKELAISENIENKGLILQDIYQWLMPSADYLRSLGNKARISPTGDPEYHLAGKWLSAPYLLIKMIQKNLSSIKKYLAPNDSLPIVAVTPSKINEKLLLLLRSALRENELTLVSWLTAPLALYLNSQYFLQRERITTLSIWIEWGSLSLAVISHRQEIPYPVAEEYIEWSWHQWGNSWPEEQFLGKLKNLLELCEREGLSRTSITHLITGGEDSWSDQIRHSVDKILPNLTFSPLPTPRMAAALGAANSTEYFQNGAWCELLPPRYPNPHQLFGYFVPESKLEIYCDRKMESLNVPLSGRILWNFPPHFQNADTLDIKIYSPDGIQFSTQVRAGLFSSHNRDFDSDERTTIIGSPSFASNNMTEPSLSVPPAMLADEKKGYMSSSSESMTSVTIKSNEESGEFLFDEKKPSIGEGDGATRVLSLSSIEPNPHPSFADESIGEGDGATRVLSLNQIKSPPNKPHRHTDPQPSKNDSLELDAADLFEEPEDDRDEQPTQRHQSISMADLDTLSTPSRTETQSKGHSPDRSPSPPTTPPNRPELQEISKVNVSLYLEKVESLTDKLRETLSEASEIFRQLEGIKAEEELEKSELKLDIGIRREIRKLLDQGRQLSKVEESRLPTSTRKSISRLVNELETSIKENDAEKAIKISLQLANRLMEIIRRDLRPW